jgi:hypothetical protein
MWCHGFVTIISMTTCEFFWIDILLFFEIVTIFFNKLKIIN